MSSPHQSVPPPESSHIPAAAEVTGTDSAPPGPTRVIRSTGLAYLGVFLLVMCVFFPIVGWPAGLFWLAIIPIAAFVWVLRTQTKVSPRGLDLRTVFSARHIDWEQLKGVAIPERGYVRAYLDDDTEVALPAVSYDRLRDLVDAARGRIPDPFALPDPDVADDTAEDSDAGDRGTDTAKDRETRTEQDDEPDSGATAVGPTPAEIDPESTSDRE